jgi:SAM-dependent methyltransferase
VTNEEQARYWNGDEAAHWLAYEDRYERMLAPFTGHVMTSAAIGRADRVIDIGCGTGSRTRAAGRVATGGQALGVDLSAAMLRRAARRAREEGLANVRFEHGDAQMYRFKPGAWDAAVSRFGVMFFANPVAAFANVGRGLRAGAGCPSRAGRTLPTTNGSWFPAPLPPGTWYSLRPVIRPLLDRSRWASAIGLPPYCATRRSPTSP